MFACIHPCLHRTRPCSYLMLKLLINVQNLQRLLTTVPRKNLFHCHKHTPSLPLPPCSLPSSWQDLPLSGGARSSGSQSANLPSICPPPQCQLTPAIPHQDSAGWTFPNLFPLASPVLPHTHQLPPFAFLLPYTPLTYPFSASSPLLSHTNR